MSSSVSAVLFAALLGAACSGQDAAADARHLVFVSLDTLRADHIGSYGHPFVQTPTLDRLAAEGVRFSQCISTASTTLSSHTSLFTGTYPHTHGVQKNGHAVHPDNTMLAEVLSGGGFVTAGFAGGAPLHPEVAFDQGFDHYDVEFPGDATYGKHRRPADAVTDSVLDWLDARRAGEGTVGTSERLFLFVHYYDIHSPFLQPAPFSGMYREDDLEVDGSNDHLVEARNTLIRAGGGSGADKEDGFAERLRKRSKPMALARALDAEYCAGITWTDSELGRLLDGLEERGVLDEALVVVTADHGETFHEHFNVFNHGRSVFETEIHVPLLVRLPGRQHAGTVVDRLTSGVDVMPTMLALLGVEAPAGMEGEDVSASFTHELPARAPVFAEATRPTHEPRFTNDPVWPNRRKYQCIRTDRFKYMFRPGDDSYRLFDLEADPDEERNLLPGGEHAELARDLRAALQTWSDDVDEERSSDFVPSDSHRDALDALGYGGGDEGE